VFSSPSRQIEGPFYHFLLLLQKISFSLNLIQLGWEVNQASLRWFRWWERQLWGDKDERYTLTCWYTVVKLSFSRTFIRQEDGKRLTEYSVYFKGDPLYSKPQLIKIFQYLKSNTLWNIIQRYMLVHRRFGGTYCVYLESRIVSLSSSKYSVIWRNFIKLSQRKILILICHHLELHKTLFLKQWGGFR
jgi:hypothetical protein